MIKKEITNAALGMEKKGKITVDITPDVSLLPKLGFSGYKVSEAISEFLDNSIDSKPSNQKILKIEILLSENSIVVVDNSSGMSKGELIDALKLALSDKKGKLGQFGLGLKTAATSLGDAFEVMTSRSDDDNWYRIKYDKEKWLENDSWKSDLEVEPKKNKTDHGTIILIEKIRFKFYPNLVTNIKKQLAFRFSSFLQNGEVNIIVNTREISPPKVTLIKGTKKKIDIELEDKKRITGWVALLNERQGLNYGFNLFKNGRLVQPYKKIGFKAHPEVALIYGELNLDFVPVTHNKREFIEDSKEYQEVEEAISIFVKTNKLVSESREYSKRKSISLIEDKIKKKLSFLDIALKKSPLAEKISDFALDYKLDSEITEKGKIQELKLSQKSFLPENIHEDETYEFKVGNEKFEVVWGLSPLGKENKWVEYFVEKNKITVIINSNFPLYSMVSSYQYYSLILIAEAISEFIVKKYDLNPSVVLKIRNIILRKAGEAQIEIEERRKMEMEKARLVDRLKEIDKTITKL
jgi:hypothetical protein